MTNDSNDILYREFFIQTTRGKLQEMTEDLIRDERVKDFGKVAEPNVRGIEVCVSDVRQIVRLCQQAKDYIKKSASLDNSTAYNLHRQLGLIAGKMIKKIEDHDSK